MSKKIKATLPFFATSITGGYLESLEDLIHNQYQEFLYVFYLLKDSTDLIRTLCHREKEEGKLSITVIATSEEDALSLVKKIEYHRAAEEDLYTVEVFTDGSRVTIKIYR